MQTVKIQEAIEIAKQDPQSPFARQLRSSIESGALDTAAQKQGVDLSVYGRPTTTMSSLEVTEDQTFLGDTLEAAKNVAGGALYGFSTPGRVIQGALSSGVEKVTGKQDFGAPATKEEFESTAGVDLDTTSGKIGSFVGQMIPYAVTSAGAGAATAGASMLTRSLAQGGASALTQAAMTGDVGKDEAVAFALGAASVPVGDAVNKGLQSLSQHFPEWLVKPFIKQTPQAKLKGKDAAKYLVESGRIGTVDDLIQQTDDAMSVLNTQIDDILKTQTTAGKTIAKTDIIGSIVDDINKAGGAIDDTEVLGIIDNLAPQARGLIQKDTLTVQEANQLRQLLDKTLGDRSFLSGQLTFNKSVLMDYTNGLRSAVQNSDETLKPLYKEYAKNITLKQALNARAVAGGGANSVGMYDLLTGGAAFGVTGDPVTSLMAMAGRRAFESAPVKTSLAQVFRNTDKASVLLGQMSPANRAVILQFASQMSREENQATTENTLE
jgi:hypothetical protein